MNTRRINGSDFEAMTRNALAYLRTKETELNNLNVFPVADGDTGTNMCLTLQHGVNNARSSSHLGAYLKTLNDCMLLGARGNSGVILSQLFKGFCLELARCSEAEVNDLKNALIRAYKTAYAAVVCPVEGTILTVAREGIEHIRSQTDRRTTVEALLSMYIAEMKKTLSYTPEMLSVLKESNVVDSGAAGYIAIFEGMLKYLYGELIQDNTSSKYQSKAADIENQAEVDAAIFNENSSFEDGYCMEFMLQLMSSPRYIANFVLDAYLEKLGLYGTSIVASMDGRRVKVHIHTFTPARIIAASQEYGEFITFKLENMQIQHNMHTRSINRQAKHTQMAIVSVANGQGAEQLLADLGCTHVINGGDKMNVSSEEFLDAYLQQNADCIVVLPNNKNSVMAAQQASQMLNGTRVEIIPSENIIEGYFALSMDITDSVDIEQRISQMKSGFLNVTSLLVSRAARDFGSDGVSCRVGDIICLSGDKLVAASDCFTETVIDGLRSVDGIDDKEACIILRGKDAAEEDEALLMTAINQAYPQIEVCFIDGGQPIYQWMIGLI